MAGMPVEAQMHVLSELLQELVDVGKRHETLLERTVMLLGELNRRQRGSFVRSEGTRGDYMREMVEAHRERELTRRQLPLIRYLASLGGKALKQEMARKYRGGIYWQAFLGLERDGLVRMSKVGRNTVVELTDLANHFFDDDEEKE